MRPLVILGVLAAVALSGVASAEVPRTVSYQGVLAEEDGSAVPDGDYSMTFRLFDAATGGSPLWTETVDSVRVAHGVFNAILGKVVPLGLDFDRSYWLSVEVEQGGEMTPRLEITASPYAFRAGIADSLVGGFPGGIGGSGTANYLAKFTSATTMGNSGVREDASGNLGIGTAPDVEAKLYIYRDANHYAKFVDATDPTHIGIAARGNNYGVTGTGGIGVYGYSAWGYGESYEDAAGAKGFGSRWGVIGHSQGAFSDRRGAGVLGLADGNAYAGWFKGSAKVDSDLEVGGFKMPTGASAGYVLTSNGSGTGTWQPAAGGGLPSGSSGQTLRHNGSTWIANSLLYNDGSRVGVNTTSPAQKLDVNGKIEVGDDTTTPTAGAIRWNGSNFAGYDGSAWRQLDAQPGGGGDITAVYADNGLTGGATTGDAHLNVGAGDGITVNADAVAVDVGDFDGNGLEESGNDLHVITGSGLTISSDAVQLTDSYLSGSPYDTRFVNRDGGDAMTATTSSYVLGVFNLGTGTAIEAFASAGSYAGLFSGKVRVDVLEIAGGADLAEPFPMSDLAAPQPGTVMSIDDRNPGKLRMSERAYDRRVAGVTSGANGVNPGLTLRQSGVLGEGQNVALTGRVWCWADASYGAIEPGDRLTTSETPGHAMKATDNARAMGAVIGKAMTGLTDGRGLVLVLVQPQ